MTRTLSHCTWKYNVPEKWYEISHGNVSEIVNKMEGEFCPFCGKITKVELLDAEPTEHEFDWADFWKEYKSARCTKLNTWEIKALQKAMVKVLEGHGNDVRIMFNKVWKSDKTFFGRKLKLQPKDKQFIDIWIRNAKAYNPLFWKGVGLC